MRFVVSSIDLLNHLQAINRVISSKNTLPILDNFLFNLEDTELTITASDLESTMITKLELENVDGEGQIAIEAKRLTDILKEFPDQPLTFEINLETLAVVINSENGKFSIVGSNAEDFPQLPAISEETQISILIPGNALLKGINKTIFATADDELRPVMNGIFMQFSAEGTKFVASDAHKLVRYSRNDIKSSGDASFILPKKPASLLKNILPKEDGEITLQFDEKNAFFKLSNYKLICRLVEGTYPNYASVIPKNNPNKLTIDRVDLFNTIKRVSVFSNQASNLVKLHLTGNQIVVSAQDIDFSISAYERLSCTYDGEEMEIGFKSVFFGEILTAINAENVVVEMSEPSKATLVLPFEKESENEDELMLIMPMMINN